jgi:hypothetical protein
MINITTENGDFPVYEYINPRPYYETLSKGIGIQLSQGNFTSKDITQMRDFFRSINVEFVKDKQMPYNPEALMILCYSLLCIHTNIIRSVNLRFNENYDLKFTPFCQSCVELIQDIEESEDLRNAYNVLLLHLNNLNLA